MVEKQIESKAYWKFWLWKLVCMRHKEKRDLTNDANYSCQWQKVRKDLIVAIMEVVEQVI